jgi:CheY-like chemotaxis protein
MKSPFMRLYCGACQRVKSKKVGLRNPSVRRKRYHQRMIQRVFVRVVGFSSVERHALNTVFRLSQDRQSARDWSYEPWLPNSPSGPRLALIDGSSPDASEALADLDEKGGAGIIWVGSISPAKAWRSFQRPLVWPSVLTCMDEYFTPRDELDVDFGGDTWPSVLESTGAHLFGEPDERRVLVADADDTNRLYLRTKLASIGITHIDEALNVVQAKEFLASQVEQNKNYDAVIVDLDLPGGNPWTVMALSGQPRLKLLIQHRLSLSSRMSAKVNGCAAMGKPLDPSRLNELLSAIQ